MPLPEARAGDVRSAFTRGAKERPLRLMVDHDRIAPGSILELLAGFVGHPDVELWSTQDNGRSPLEFDWTPRSDDQVLVHWICDPHRSLTGVWPASQYCQAAGQAVSHGLAADEDAAYRELVHAAAACADRRVDALVTDSALLLGRPGAFAATPWRQVRRSPPSGCSCGCAATSASAATSGSAAACPMASPPGSSSPRRGDA